MKKSGFTLVELLVVISIIAILSVIGITVFSGVQKSARDARRRADIDAIAKAMEVHYGQCGAGGVYCNLDNTAFSGGAVPKDPMEGQVKCGYTSAGNLTWCGYCFLTPGIQGYYNNPPWNAAEGGCGAITTTQTSGYYYNVAQIGSPGATDGGATLYRPTFSVCANLETPTGNPNPAFPSGTYYYCAFSQQ